MKSIAELLAELCLHDSTLVSLNTDGNGIVDLAIDIDEVWNRDLDRSICGLRFKSVFEIMSFKIDRMNIIESVEFTDIEDYDTQFVVDRLTPQKIVLVNFEFVAGGQLSLVCADDVEFLRKSPNPELERAHYGMHE